MRKHRWEDAVGPAMMQVPLLRRYFRWAKHRKPNLVRKAAMSMLLLKISLEQALRV